MNNPTHPAKGAETAAKATEAAKTIKAEPHQSDDLWKAIKIGSVVLAKEPGPGEERGFWPVSVLEITGKSGEYLTVRYTEYKKLPSFRVNRNAVALLRK